jgi:sucrose-6-phosphate hydrolase SacC (GH32 family)
MFYRGFYHIFFQHNPDAPSWGEARVWGHAVSCDMIHWDHLNNPLIPDKWYDVQGVWVGSVTVRDDGIPVIMYTGELNFLLESEDNSDQPETKV